MLPARDVTRLLLEWRGGNKAALDEMMPLVYDELRRIARHYLERERADHTLQPTALVHEAYLRLVGQHSVDWQNRAQFLGVAAQMMRRILVNHAEAHKAAKREGYANRVTLAPGVDAEAISQSEIDIVDLDTALNRLAELDVKQAKVVELRFFGGLTIEETAEVVGVSPATIKREWTIARMWLLRELQGS
jgi:RNA polymerase sigma factor (TIGR02999 family)